MSDVPGVMTAIEYASEEVFDDTGSPTPVSREIANLNLVDFLICHEFKPNTGYKNPRVRPVHGNWLIGSWDYKFQAQANKPLSGGGTISDWDFLQGSFGMVKGWSYGAGRMELNTCDSDGSTADCTVNESLQCFTADQTGKHISGTQNIFASSFDEYTDAGNSWVKVFSEALPTDSQGSYVGRYTYKVAWGIPAGASSGDYIIKLGYDQAVFKTCGFVVGGSLTQNLLIDPTGYAGPEPTQLVECELNTGVTPTNQPSSTLPMVVAALFAKSPASTETYSDNVEFGYWADDVETVRVTSIVTGGSGGSVSANLSPVPVNGQILGCTAQCSADYAKNGAPVVLTANPSNGYQLSATAWSASDPACVVDAQNPAKVQIDPTADATCRVDFEGVPRNVSASVQGGVGTINGSSSPVSLNVPNGNSTSLNLMPAAGYSLDGMNGISASAGCDTANDSLVSDPQNPGGFIYTTGALSGNCTIGVTFAPNQYTVAGSIAGLASLSGVSLKLSAGAAAPLTEIDTVNFFGSGAFEFTGLTVPYGGQFNVEVVAATTGYSCTAEWQAPGAPQPTPGPWTVPAQNITGMAITCSTP